jgi:hypothetical protein
MKFPRKALVSPLDVGKRRASLNSEDDVKIHMHASLIAES